MRSLLLAGAAIAAMASPSYAFNIGSIHQFGAFNSTGISSQLSAGGIDKLYSNNIQDGVSVGAFNHNQINQYAGKWSTNTAGAYQLGVGNDQHTIQTTANGSGYYYTLCIKYNRQGHCVLSLPPLPIPTHLNSNTAWTVQVGGFNYSLTYQLGGTGKGNHSGVLQIGWGNSSAVFQIGGNKQGTYQIGLLNSSLTGQLGHGNKSNTLQIGAFNDAVTLQAGKHNDADTTQIGVGNESGTVQLGYYNDASTKQVGANNVSNTIQVGAGNSSEVTQVGLGNSSEVSQSDQGNWAAVGQVGVGNQATLVQSTY